MMAAKKGKKNIQLSMLTQLYNMKSSTNQKLKMPNRYGPQESQEEGPSIKVNCMKLTDASQNLKSEAEIARMLSLNEQKDGSAEDERSLIDTLRPVKTLMPRKRLCGANCTNCVGCKVSTRTPSGQRPFSVVYDQMHIENEATPMGLGMEADDTIAILPSMDVFISNPGLRERVVKLTTRRNKTVSLGLNVSIGEEEGGLPYPTELINHDPSCFEVQSLSTLCQIITDADRKTAGCTTKQKMSTCHSEISNMRFKIEANEFAGICQLLTEIVLSLKRCKEKGTHHPDDYPSNVFNPCDQLDNILYPVWERNNNAEACFRELIDTASFLLDDDQVSQRIRESSFYVGPVRNSTPWNYLSALPIVQLAPFVIRKSTVDELVEAWVFYVMKEEFEILEKPTYLLYNEKRIPLGQNINVEDVIDMDMKKHYFCLPQLKWNDGKGVDRLMEFIEGGKPPEQEKEKKRKKKKKKAPPTGNEEVEANGKEMAEAKPVEGKEGEVLAVSTGSRASSEGRSGPKQDAKEEGKKSQSKVEESNTLDKKVQLERKMQLEKKMHLQRKRAVAVEMIGRMGAIAERISAIASSDEYFGALVDMQKDISRRSYVEDWRLAGYAEAIVASLLNHFYGLEASKVPASLDLVLDLDLNTSGLLLDVSSVAQKHVNAPDPTAIHKFQVLLRAEAHKVLTTQEKKQEYEDGMIAHLRQIALQDSKAAMIDFIGTTITQCYMDNQPELLTILQEKLKVEWPAQPSPTTSDSGMSSEVRQESGSLASGSAEYEADRKELAGAKPKVKQKKNKKNCDMDPMASRLANKSVRGDNAEEGVEATVDTGGVQPKDVQESLITPAKLQDAQHFSLHHNENEVDSLALELKCKETKLHELLTSEVCLVESKGKEMSVLISAVDEVEDEKHAVQKKVAEIEANMREMQIRKNQLVNDMEVKDQKLEKLLKKKHKLENFIAEKISESKQEKSQLEKEIEDIKAKQERQRSEEIARNKIGRLQPENLKLLEYIDSKIDAKEKELECPVCLEVSSVPIFCCDDQHIICSDCRPKVSICPECRDLYPSKPRRHRYAEKAAEELAGFKRERAKILDS